MHKKISVENILWFLLLFTCVGVLYFEWMAVFLLSIVIIHALYSMKSENEIISKGIVFLINYLPFYTIIRVSLILKGFETFSGILNYFRDLIIILLLITCIKKRGIRLYREDSAWIVFFINWITGLAITAINGYLSLGVSGLHLSVIPMVLYYVIVYGECEINVENVIRQFMKIAMVVAIVGLLAYLARPAVYCQLFSKAGNGVLAANYVRFVSVFFTPNVCGCFFAIAVTIALVQFVYKKRCSYLMMTVLFACCLVLTLSRGSWAFVAVVVFVFLCILKPKFGIPLLCLVGMGLFIVFVLGSAIFQKNNVMLSVIWDRVLSLFDISNASSYGRISIGFEYLKLLSSNLLGLGLGVATTAQMSYGTLSGVDIVDGFYIKSIVETGIIGVCYIIVFVVWLIQRSYYSYREHRNRIGVIAFLLSIGFLFQSLGSNTFDFICTAPILWIFLGVSVKTNKKKCV